jgi:hypothetical protein
MTENILAMTLRMRNHAVTQARLLGTELRNTGGAAKTFGSQFGQAMKGANVGMDGFLTKLISVKQLIALTFAYKMVEKFAGFLGSLTDAANESETAFMRLAQNLASFGNYTPQAVTGLNNYANTLSTQVGITNNVISSNMALLASFGMTDQKIRELTPLVIDFAKAKGMDLETAFNMIGKASVGSTTALSRYGIVLDDNMSKAEKFAAVQAYLGQYAGTAEALTETYAGKVSVLGANWDQAKESLGEIIQRTVMQSGLLQTMTSLVQGATAFFEKWGVVIADVAKNALVKLGNAFKWFGDIVTSDTSLFIFGELAEVLKRIYWGGHAAFVAIKTGLADMSDMLAVVIAKGQQFWSWIFGSKEEYEQAKKVSDEIVSKFWNDIDKRSQEAGAAIMDDMKNIANSWALSGKMFTAEGFAEYKAKLEERRRLLQQQADTEKNTALSTIQNRKAVNTELEKTFQLTKQMASQFATSSRVEQEQTKYLLQKLRNISPEGIAGLSEQEKKLINKQEVLKSAYQGVFNEYAEKQLGIKRDKENTVGETKLKVELTEEARRIFKITGEDKQNYRNVSFEKAMAG